jgi:hypothetical protein
MAARIGELRVEANRIADDRDARDPGEVYEHLELAEQAVGSPQRLRDWLTGRAIEDTSLNVAGADAMLLELQSAERVRARIPEILATVRANLPSSDPRRVAIEARQQRMSEDLTDRDRLTLAAGLRGAYSAMTMARDRVRRLRNLVAFSAVAMTIILGVIVVIGSVWPSVLPICSVAKQRVVCPTGFYPLPSDLRFTAAAHSAADIPLVALLGLIGAALSAIRTLSATRDTSSGYSHAVAAAVLKLPVGSVTAVLGVLLLASGIVPGITALESPASYVAFALLFGYAQRMFTGRIDDRAGAVVAAAARRGGRRAVAVS